MSSWYDRNKEEQLRRNYAAKQADPEKWKAWARASYHRRKNDPDNVKAHLLRHAKARAKKKGVPFDITVDDILIPSHCPIMGWEITGVGEDVKTSASIDRIIPELGYVKGNIRVISTQANRMKWDSTQEELELFCRGVLSLGQEGRSC